MTRLSRPAQLTRGTRRIGIVGVALLPLIALTGCTQGSDDVASLGKETGAATVSTQKENTQRLVDCLNDAGIPAETVDEGDDQAGFQFTSEEPYYWAEGNMRSLWPGGTEDNPVTLSEAEASAFQAKYDAMMTGHEGVGADGRFDKPFLAIGDTNYSEAYQGCLASSQYTPPEATLDPGTELKVKQAAVEVTAKWTACARENGLPTMKDPAPAVVDNWETSPQVYIPLDTPEDLLRSLIDACPVFDVAAHQKVDAAIAEAGDSFDEDTWEPVQDPWVGIEIPQGSGSEDKTSGDQGGSDRFRILDDILSATSAEYWSPTGMGPEPAPAN
jgi:hypothetical protein